MHHSCVATLGINTGRQPVRLKLLRSTPGRLKSSWSRPGARLSRFDQILSSPMRWLALCKRGMLFVLLCNSYDFMLSFAMSEGSRAAKASWHTCLGLADDNIACSLPQVLLYVDSLNASKRDIETRLSSKLVHQQSPLHSKS